jgi:hypothetical protein
MPEDARTLDEAASALAANVANGRSAPRQLSPQAPPNRQPAARACSCAPHLVMRAACAAADASGRRETAYALRWQLRLRLRLRFRRDSHAATEPASTASLPVQLSPAPLASPCRVSPPSTHALHWRASSREPMHVPLALSVKPSQHELCAARADVARVHFSGGGGRAAAHLVLVAHPAEARERPADIGGEHAEPSWTKRYASLRSASV